MVAVVIATIMRSSGDTGVQTHFQSFCQWLAQKGRKVSLVTPYGAPLIMVYPIFAIRRLIDPLHEAASVWWYRYWHTVFLRMALRRQLMDGSSRIVYAQCPLSADAALRSRRNTDQKVVLVVHFNVSQADEWAGKGKIEATGSYAKQIRAFEREVFERVDGIVFVSDFMRREIFSRNPGLRTSSVVVPNFVADPIVLGCQEKNQPQLINIGTLEPRKNQAYLIEILAALRDQGMALRLTLIGDGPDAESLKVLAHQLGLQGQVDFLGHMAHGANRIEGHQAYVHTATMESFGITLIEAMARGVPVFACPVGGIPEVFTDTVEGGYLPADDPVAAAKQIARALMDSDWMSKAGVAARQRFLKDFQSDVAAEKLMGFLDCVAVGDLQ